jgi:hypothetical protein
MMTVTTDYDAATGRPLHNGGEALETLADDELEAELTVALLDAERRELRVNRLVEELRGRRGEPTQN